MKPTLVVLAAGMGSRYGGLKQVDPVGPSGEAILDYSVFDAVRGGFGKVVFIIRKDFEVEFKEKVGKKYEGLVPVEYCFQDINDLPEPYKVPEGRTKPWGTAHATRAARTVVNEPFAVINADDFYGQDAFRVMGDCLRSLAGEKGRYCMVGYHVANTLSANGSVSRGVCTTDSKGYLTDVVERTHIEAVGNKVVFTENGEDTEIDPMTPVSMNMWGFTPDYFTYPEEAFKQFLTSYGQELKKEFYIPTLVNDLIRAGKVTCQVLSTPSKWFGVTYAEDREQVIMQLNQLIKQGVYPQHLF